MTDRLRRLSVKLGCFTLYLREAASATLPRVLLARESLLKLWAQERALGQGVGAGVVGDGRQAYIFTGAVRWDKYYPTTGK